MLRKICNLSFILISAFFISSCDNRSDNNKAATIVFRHGKVYTVNPAQPWAEAVAVDGNKIAYVGNDEGAKKFIGDRTQVIDLKGKMMLPGFVSSHDHLIAGQWSSYGVDLLSAKTKEEYLAKIKEYVASHPDEKIILGIGWNPALYGSMPTAKELDEIVSDRPAILLEFTMHDAWLNTKALEEGGITKDTPDAVPGVTYWARDDEGNPTGVGHEFAWMPVYIKIGAWQPEKIIPSSQKFYYDHAVSYGLTTFLNPGIVTPQFATFDGMKSDYKYVMNMLHEKEKKGELPLRTFTQPIYKDANTDPEEFAKVSAEFAKQYNTDNLRSFGVKIHPEGNWSSRTSLMLEPYLPKNEDEHTIDRPTPTSYGAAGVKADRMKEVVLAANAQGLDVFTHCDGSATVRAMIDAIDASNKAGYSDKRNAIHHLFWTHPDDFKRIIEMNIPINVTPNFSTDWSGQDVLAVELLGNKRIDEQFAIYNKIFDAGNVISITADVPAAPVEHLNPLFNMQAAMTYRDPTNPNSKVFPPGRKGITLEQAIKGVTIYPAWHIRMENKIGSIEVGKYADFVVLDKNLFDVQPDKIVDVKVWATMMDGKFTYGPQN